MSLTLQASRVDAPAASASDEELARAVVAGRLELFELIMRRNNQRLYRAVRSYVRDETEIEDILQQAYLSAFSHLATFSGGSKLSTWLVRIAINEALGRLRKNQRLVAVPLRPSDEETDSMESSFPNPSPEDQAASRELGTLIEAAVDALPDLYRVVFVLREIEKLSTAETAGALGVTEEVVKTRLHRAKALLKQTLENATSREIPRAFEFGAQRCDRLVAGVMGKIRAG